MNRLLLIPLVLLSATTISQEEFKKDMYRGNSQYDLKEYEEAIKYFDKIIDQSPLNYKANFNKGNSLFRMKEYEKASEIFSSISDLAPSTYDRSKVFHNLGNSAFMDGELEDAIDAYKNSLRLNPGDQQTRYNLAYAQLKKKEKDQQQQQNQQNQQGEDGNQGDQNQNQDQQENSEDQDQQNQDQENGEDQENQDQQNGDDPEEQEEKNEDQQEGDTEDGRKEENKTGNYENERVKMSKEQARRILEAAYKSEKGVKERLEKRKLIANGKANKKDW